MSNHNGWPANAPRIRETLKRRERQKAIINNLLTGAAAFIIVAILVGAGLSWHTAQERGGIGAVHLHQQPHDPPGR